MQTVAGEALRTLQHVRIQGIGTEDSVCVACFWKDALATGGSSSREEQVGVEGAEERERNSVFTVCMYPFVALNSESSTWVTYS